MDTQGPGSTQVKNLSQLKAMILKALHSRGSQKRLVQHFLPYNFPGLVSSPQRLFSERRPVDGEPIRRVPEMQVSSCAYRACMVRASEPPGWISLPG